MAAPASNRRGRRKPESPDVPSHPFRIYHIDQTRLEPLFSKWEKKWHDDGGKDINNPKVPLTFAQQNGTKVYPAGIPEAAQEALSLVIAEALVKGPGEGA